MSDGNALIELGKLAEPAKVLIEKVSDAVGGICKPWQIKRIAKAEIEAALIKAEGKLKIDDVEERGLLRVITQAGHRQKNIEQITAKAIPLLNEESMPNQIDDDWLAYFFNKCDLVSDKEMQTVWAKILAEEAKKKGSFNKRSLNLVSTLEKEDAELFSNFCGYVFKYEYYFPIVLDFSNEIYKKNNINFSSLNHLGSIGLITHSMGYEKIELPSEFSFRYFDEIVKFKLRGNNTNLEIGEALLTDIGQQLVTICGAKKVPGFIEYIKKYFGERIIS